MFRGREGAMARRKAAKQLGGEGGNPVSPWAAEDQSTAPAASQLLHTPTYFGQAHYPPRKCSPSFDNADAGWRDAHIVQSTCEKHWGKWRNTFTAPCGFARQNSTVASYSRASSKLNKARRGLLSAWIVCFKEK